MTYQEKLKDPRWQKCRLEVFNAASWHCEDCFTDKKELQVHHCYYLVGKEPWDHPLELMMALCPDCHKARQQFESEMHIILAKSIRRTGPEGVEAAAWEIINFQVEIENQQRKEPFKL